MKKFISTAPAFFCLLYVFYSCNSNKSEQEAGETVAKNYCASCHIFPDASLVDKKTWAKNILPVMGNKLGIKYYGGQPYANINITQGQNNSVQLQQASSISLEDWNKIIAYYQAAAPDTMPGLNRPPVTQFTTQFSVKEAVLDKGFPSASYIKIDPANKWIYAANVSDSSFSIYDSGLKQLSEQNIHGIMVDMNFDSGMAKPGLRAGVYTNIGYINPNEGRTGTANNYTIGTSGKFTVKGEIAANMPRPVQVTPCDLDKDGKTDYLVCGFGNKAGEFYWMRNKGDGTFEKKMLWAIPGAIKAYIKDFNKDGLPDIMVLFAQAEEGIYLFTNKGNGEFEKRDLLRFPPIYGSCYFELDDFNNDGYEDILYSCGDNADYSPAVLKNYHGLYIYLNDGNYNFKQAYFFPMYGCYKAVARDFDKDGDLDIAAISFFPDKKNHPQESFIYLENKGGFNFTPYAIPQFGMGNWITMDAGDITGDGYDDIVIGNFDMPEVRRDSRKQQKNKAAFLLLENQGAKHK